MESNQKIKRRAPQIPHREAPPPPYVRLQKKTQEMILLFLSISYTIIV